MSLFRFGRQNSFGKTLNVEEWSKKDLETWLERIGIDQMIIDKMKSKNNPMSSSIESGKFLLSAGYELFNNANSLFSSKQQWSSLYDPYTAYDPKIEGVQQEQSTIDELAGLMGLFIQMNPSLPTNTSSVNSPNSNQKPPSKFTNTPTHPIIRTRLDSLDNFVKLWKKFLTDGNRKSGSGSSSSLSSPILTLDQANNFEWMNDFNQFQNSFLLDHLMCMLFFQQVQAGNSKTKKTGTDSGILNFIENVKLGHVRKITLQLYNVKVSLIEIIFLKMF